MPFIHCRFILNRLALVTLPYASSDIAAIVLLVRILCNCRSVCYIYFSNDLLLVYLLYTSPTKTADYSMLVASKQQIGDPTCKKVSNSRLGVYSTSSRVQDVYL